MAQPASVWITSVALAFHDDRPERPYARRRILRRGLPLGLRPEKGAFFRRNPKSRPETPDGRGRRGLSASIRVDLAASGGRRVRWVRRPFRDARPGRPDSPGVPREACLMGVD